MPFLQHITVNGDLFFKKNFLLFGIQHRSTPPEKDRATTTGHLRTKFPEDRSSGSSYMLVDTQTHRQTDGSITILRTPTWAEYSHTDKHIEVDNQPYTRLKMINCVVCVCL